MINFTFYQLLKFNLHLGKSNFQLHHQIYPYINFIRNNLIILNLVETILNLRLSLYFFRYCGKQNYQILFALSTFIYNNFKNLIIKSNQFYLKGKWICGLLTNFFFVQKYFKKQISKSPYQIFLKQMFFWKNRLNFFKFYPNSFKFFGFLTLVNFKQIKPIYNKKMKIKERRLNNIKVFSNLIKFPSAIISLGFVDQFHFVTSEINICKIPSLGLSDSNNYPGGYTYTSIGNNNSNNSITFIGKLCLNAINQGKYLHLLQLKKKLLNYINLINFNYLLINLFKINLNFLNLNLNLRKLIIKNNLIDNLFLNDLKQIQIYQKINQFNLNLTKFTKIKLFLFLYLNLFNQNILKLQKLSQINFFNFNFPLIIKYQILFLFFPLNKFYFKKLIKLNKFFQLNFLLIFNQKIINLIFPNFLIKFILKFKINLIKKKKFLIILFK
jgi:ribosomal protein S2